MDTGFRTERDYTVQGVVVDRATQRGVRGLLVEAWDRDTKYNDMLGQVITDDDGAFTVRFDSDYFGNAKPDNGADVFFKVFMDDREVLSTFDRPLHNMQPGSAQVRLEIDLPQLQPLGQDRVSAEQAFKAIDWWQASDFRGVYHQGRDKTSTVGRMGGALLGDALKRFDFAPVRPQSTREKEIVNQTPDSARVALRQQQVEVTQVKPASTLGSAAGVRQMTGYPLNLRAGDRVTLYEENGVVKYYTRDPAPASTADGATVARIDEDVQAMKARVAGMADMRTDIANVRTANADVAARTDEEAAQSKAQALELARLQRQLEAVQQASAGKDVQIAKLQSDLVLVTKAQDALGARLPLARLDAIEQRLDRLSLQTAAPPRDAALPADAPAAAPVDTSVDAPAAAPPDAAADVPAPAPAKAPVPPPPSAPATVKPATRSRPPSKD